MAHFNKVTSGARYEYNDAHNGVEIYFKGKPEQKIIDALKAARWRWHNAKKCWYNKQSAEALELAKRLTKECV